MLPFLETFWPVYLTVLAMIIFLIVDKVRRRTHRKRVRRFDFPLKWIKILEQNVPLYVGMPYDLQEHCQNLVMQFIEDKLFEPCGGIETVTEEMMVTIAGNAVIPILGRPTDIYRSVRTILIYPSTFFQNEKPW
jgi:MtfA peptidase